MLGYNMFAYCRNNPISRKDAMGTDDVCVTDVNDDDNPLNDLGTYYRPGGATATGGNGGSAPGGNTGGSASGKNVSDSYSTPRFGDTSSNSNGSGGNSGKFTFKSEAVLNEHYNKHNSEFGNVFSNSEEYADAANYVIQNGEYVPSQNAYVKFYGMNGRANYAFVGMSNDHLYITTFHLKHVSQIMF